MDHDKLNEAAEKCLAFAIGTDRPFGRVADFIALLKSDPHWTDAEIVVAQTRIIRALMKRIGGDERAS
jgi:hypothetical protein